MVIDTTNFNVKGFYAAMAESKSLLVAREDLKWSERFVEPDRPYDVLLAFGCAVQHTPHLMQEATNVLDVLGVDYFAVTGRQFCCGRPFDKMGKALDVADRVSGKSYERFMAYNPKAAVQWCGACMRQYLDTISQQQDPPFAVVHVTKFLADLLAAQGDDIPWKKEVKTRVVLHAHDNHAQADVDTASILRILDMVPGVEYAGPIEPPSAGNPCDLEGPLAVGVLNKSDSEVIAGAVRELEDQTAAVGADTLVTAYHRCQAEWSKLSTKKMAVREWISLVAEALGVGVQDRYTMYWHLGDPKKIIEESRPQWESWGLTEEQALDVAERHFVRENVVDVHQCDCGGTGCGSGGSDLLWPGSIDIASLVGSPPA
jgi:Fe-S oxidoreductase